MNHQQEIDAAIAERDAEAEIDKIYECRKCKAKIAALESDKAALLAALKNALEWLERTARRDETKSAMLNEQPQGFCFQTMRDAIAASEGRNHA